MALELIAFESPARDWEAAQTSFFHRCKSLNLSPCTLDYYFHRFKCFREYLDTNAPGTTPAEVTANLVREYVGWEAKERSPSTANHTLVSLKALYNHLRREGAVEKNILDAVEKVRCKKKVIPTFTTAQVEAVLNACGKDFRGIRDRAIIMTLLDCGLRVSELTGLRLPDLDWNEQTLLILGKGCKERVVPFGRAAKQALMAYAGRRGELPTSALFVNAYGDPLTRFRVGRIIAERCMDAGITGVRCSPHTFRHTFAVQYLRNGGDVFSLQKMLGHSDLSMTRRYAELSSTDVLEKHRLFSPGDRLQTKSAGGRKRLR